MKRLLALAVALFASVASAQSLGVYGQRYLITEVDMLALLQRKAQEFVDSGRYEKWKDESIARAKKSIETPDPLPLDVAIEKRSWYYDPAYVAPEAVRDGTGRLIVEAGTRVNPLDYLSLRERLVFFDGRNEAQVRFAVQQAGLGPTILIMTGGKWIELSRSLQRRLYFDQIGLAAKFGITAVPAVVVQEGTQLLIQEIPIED